MVSGPPLSFIARSIARSTSLAPSARTARTNGKNSLVCSFLAIIALLQQRVRNEDPKRGPLRNVRVDDRPRLLRAGAMLFLVVGGVRQLRDDLILLDERPVESLQVQRVFERDDDGPAVCGAPREGDGDVIAVFHALLAGERDRVAISRHFRSRIQ